jgi:hypothetical protein
MPDTFPALVVLVLALLPGALYVWSFERIVGPWGVGLSDRVLRFIGASAILHAIAAPVTFWLYRVYVHPGLGTGDLPIQLWLAPLAYVGVPIALGSVIGIGVRRQWRWIEVVTGRDPAPRAWDYLFGKRPDGWVLLLLKSGVWLGGAYAETESGWRSYVSGYPEPQDIFLVESVEVDPETGEFELDDDGEPLRRGSSILVRWDEVEYLEFIDA